MSERMTKKEASAAVAALLGQRTDKATIGIPFVMAEQEAAELRRGGTYAQPLTAVGPVQSGTLREVKRP